MPKRVVSNAPGLDSESDGLRLLFVALSGAVLFHGGLLPFTHANTYDAFIHMFFADHYHRSWFGPWEPRWYTGFSTTSYPPGTHMAIAALMHMLPLRAAFVVVQLIGILLLTIGVYRFALLWVLPRAAGFAAIALVLSSSISETVHLFGQLPTIFSLGVFLNGLPFVYRWIAFGGIANFGAAVVFAAATTAAHHVTTIFGGLLFVAPLAAQALRAVADIRPAGNLRARLRTFVGPLLRGGVLAVFMLAAIVITVFPYWYWSVSDPITQVPIPHGSRESFIERPDLGLIFFVLPWGLVILFLPYVVYQTGSSRLWPLGVSLMFCFVLGTGGTTEIPRAILHGAFDILTLDRFTFWSTILILPFVGHMMAGLLYGRSAELLQKALGRGIHRVLLAALFCGMVLVATFIAILPVIQPTQPRFIDPRPITQFLSEDEHDRWRYLTLGFGDQFAYVSAQTTAQSVDGNYHSARRLPDMTRFSVERLENAKYLGVPGLGSLRQFLEDAESYHLKYVFSNDEFYDPILHFTGWTRLNRLGNGVTVWEKPDISPLPLFQPRRDIPRVHAIMWGVLPPAALLLAAAIFVAGALRRNFGTPMSELRPALPRQTMFSNPMLVRAFVVIVFAGLVGGIVGLAVQVSSLRNRPISAEDLIATYYTHLDYRRFHEAYELLDPETRPPFDEVMFAWRWRGGLIASYGKLADVKLDLDQDHGPVRDYTVRLNWLTALDSRNEDVIVQVVARNGRWYVTPTALRPVQTPVRLQREAGVNWNVVGRRQPRPETNLHRDRLDRPRIGISGSRLVKADGRYAVVGLLTNADADPAAASLFGSLLGNDDVLAEKAHGIVIGQRLMPAESAGFRISFEGTLSLEDDLISGGYDPTMYIPPQLANTPDNANLEARALVAADEVYRGVALNNIRITETAEGPLISGLAVNTGTETATITRIVFLLYDENGLPIWADATFVESNLYPGQSSAFRYRLRARDTVEVVADLDPSKYVINGSSQQTDLQLPDALTGTLPMPEGTGYTFVRLHVSSMTHDPVF